MQIRKDFEYHKNLHSLISSALLHLLFQVSTSSRYVPVTKRNEILLKYLKPKLNDKRLSNIKKDIRLMIQTARSKGSNLEMKLYELNEKAKQTKIAGAEKLYSLLVYLYDEERIESRLYEEGQTAEPSILYLLEEHIDHYFDHDDSQIAPLSMLIQLERAPELINVINQHGWFIAEMKEWNSDTLQAHLLLHPATKY
ncbi:DUF2913 family protein [Vibrio maritimus]|uniref:DUF2913 family protein n=1 Tax=Vibrio maritimus TaxID=990268 RepID=UPI001F22A6D6|nr:DUF2913 family protein [Vibrio maritimus]